MSSYHRETAERLILDVGHCVWSRGHKTLCGKCVERQDQRCEDVIGIERALAAAEAMGRESERDACAETAERYRRGRLKSPIPFPLLGELIAAAIRSRKDQQT